MESRPPSSGDLFLSSPRACHGRLGPEDEFLLLLAKAQLVKCLPTPIAGFLDASPAHKALFNQVFSRQVELLKSRSQAFEDGHVTVYDKTLLTLTRNGNDLENPAAIAYYCEEYLGMNTHDDPADSMRILQQSVTLPALLKQERSPPASTRHFAPAIKAERLTSPNPAPSIEPNLAEMEPKLARLWSVYERARADFVASSAMSDSVSTASAAKFLRDTAENTLQYLQNKNTDPIMMAELTATYNMAKSTAVSLTGGRKRKFDVADMDRVKGTPRGPSNLPSKARRESGSGCLSDSYRKHRASARPARYTEERGGDEGLEKNNGRGHSGIPFGYNRAVDSYQPQ